VRVDHRFRDADSVFFRYTEQRNTIFTSIGEAGSTSGGSQGRNYGGAGYTFLGRLSFWTCAPLCRQAGVDAGQQNQHQAGLDPMKNAGFLDVDKYKGLLVSLSNWTNGGITILAFAGPRRARTRTGA